MFTSRTPGASPLARAPTRVRGQATDELPSCSETAAAVSGMELEKAIRYLEDVQTHKQCVPFRRHNGAVYVPVWRCAIGDKELSLNRLARLAAAVPPRPRPSVSSRVAGPSSRPSSSSAS